MKKLLAVCFACVIRPSVYWNYYGHLLVAGVAYCLLTEHSPEVLKRVEYVLSRLRNNQTRYERDHLLVESAVFADVIKREGGYFYESWHFNDYSLCDDEKIGVFLGDVPRVGFVRRSKKQYHMNVVSALDMAYAALADPAKDSVSDNQLLSYVLAHYGYDRDIAESVVLRLLIHYVGDIVQPLHNANKNDRGGNDFPLKPHYRIDNLHALWDSVLYKFHNVSELPFGEGWEYFIGQACSLSNYFAFESDYYESTLKRYLKHSAGASRRWSEESHLLAANAYQGIYRNYSVPIKYLIQNYPIALKQLVLAGYRLAFLLNDLYSE